MASPHSRHEAAKSSPDGADGVQVAVTSQHLADLLDPIASAVQQHDLQLATVILLGQQVIDQLLVIVGACIHKHQLVLESPLRLARL